ASDPPSRLDALPILGAAVASLLIATTVSARDENPGQWYNDGQAELKRALQRKPIEGPVKNIILFVGDGMGITTVTAARIFDGQLDRKSTRLNSSHVK